ncbi:uncharacterized protein FSUBG_12061 [Fusarium subglutinans]|uniref:DUF4185 domain-containing protein n=1 Tax=Gibberella subglutinans TaxID=42677 RepID=A0A8H5P1T6_GIBSU|nr:uncharacterized protein FSUBG_12061 [Fusarium subglutinans]KAF5586674.1 hypothetical protein FSUBG_12061 [Fusarium subglutinans]
MKRAVLMLAALVATLFCLCWGESTEQSVSSVKPSDWNADFAYEVVSRYMLHPLEELPMTYGSMTSPADSETIGTTHQDACPADDGGLNPPSPEQSFKDQVDDLLTILRDIWLSVRPAFPGAGRILIVISLSSPSRRNGLALPVLLLEASPPMSGYLPTTTPDVWKDFELALQDRSTMRIMKTLSTWSATPPRSCICTSDSGSVMALDYRDGRMPPFTDKEKTLQKKDKASLHHIMRGTWCWIGSDCGRLDLAPATRHTGYNHTYESPSREDFGIWPNASWGGRIVQDRDNKRIFHLFTVQFSHGCGLKGWRPHSYIIRAESHNGPQGPYTYAQDVSKNFAHNPDIVWSPADKKYLLYSIGVEYDKNFTKCESISYTRWPNNISVSAADNIRGTWSPFKMILDSDRPSGIHATNPSAFPLWTHNNPTREIVLGIKDYSIFTAKSWNSDYKLIYQATWNVTEQENPEWTEDPFIWRDRRGNWHSINHWMIDYVENDKQQWPRVGSHLFSRKLTGPWHFKLQEAFSSNITFTDGSWQVFKRRERPKLFFSDDGKMTPLYLTNGVQEMNQTGAAFTLVQPIGTKWKEFEKDLGF